MEDVAQAAGLQAKVGQSPFALARGVGFERLLFQEDAQRMRKALIQAGVLTADAGGFVDLRLCTSGEPLASLDAACERFEQLVREWAYTPREARPGMPALIAVLAGAGERARARGCAGAPARAQGAARQRQDLRHPARRGAREAPGPSRGRGHANERPGG